MMWRARGPIRIGVALLSLSPAACEGAGRVDADAAPFAEAARSLPAWQARVDTVAGRLDSRGLAAVRARSAPGRQVVLLFVRDGDVGTCEDLGRQARALQRWASTSRAEFLVWAHVDGDGRVQSFLERERIPGAAVFLADSAPRLEDGRVSNTPAAFLVDTGTGEVRGVAHPERVPNVRQRSFAEELAGIAGR